MQEFLIFTNNQGAFIAIFCAFIGMGLLNSKTSHKGRSFIAWLFILISVFFTAVLLFILITGKQYF
ncbi:hypothetical protein [Listeria sp. PSOL-1]|uniref:hypothetical protein n=1 Tax=Listeria sp. PSOL-1 TaxID=1844999 RepID=UPI0013D1B2C1|nr:hypothetical protein [Listeria sp. PSOL-1]